ncbi:hypothetical protein ABPG72_022273 [Tetrahymena utriculariae]
MIALPKRPQKSAFNDANRICQRVKLLTNMFVMQIEEPQSSNQGKSQSYVDNIICYQYDVEFEPSIAEDNRNLRYAVFKKASKSIEDIIGKFSFSGKSLFSMMSLKKDKIDQIKSIESIDADGQKYTILLRFTKCFEVNEESAQNLDKTSVNFRKGNQVTQLLHVILKTIMREQNYKEIGKNSKFFDIYSKSEIVIENRDKTKSVLEAYKGFTFNASPSQQKLFLMVDYASRILRKETALQYMNQSQNESNNKIVGQSVITKYNNFQIYLINRVDFNKTPSSTFFCKKSNKQISFAQYYKERYNITIQKMNQPLLVHKRKYREPNTNTQKVEEVFLIPEICFMTGLTDEQRKDFQAMKEVANHTKLSPQQRYLNSVKNCQFLSAKAKSSGLQIDHQSNQIEAIQLKPPRITFGAGKFANTERSNFDMRAPTLDKFKFHDWSIICNRNDKNQAENFVDMLKRASQAHNIDVQNPSYFETKDWKAQNWINQFDKQFIDGVKQLPQFVVTFGKFDSLFYSQMKEYFASQNGPGIASQHITPRSMQKNAMSVASKIALQIASKLGGTIWSVEIPKGINPNTMIIGIETSMKKIKNQQVAGIVASLNKDFTQYYSEIDVRKDNDTALPTLSNIIKKALEAFEKCNNILPEEIIIYRQGLGEGQIQQSLKYEINAIQNAFKSMKSQYNPRFAFFQVNKKVGQKFYQQSQRQSEEIQNPGSGTIIASEVIQNNFEFFMAAQNCNSGVCTPTKYTCLYNSTNLKEDQFWQLTYFQTFNYYNWQGPVRIPAAMKYAEKLAKFISDTLQDQANEDLATTLFYL